MLKVKSGPNYKQLAKEMAYHTKKLREQINLVINQTNEKGSIQDLFHRYETSYSAEEFSDILAQAITCGLFTFHLTQDIDIASGRIPFLGELNRDDLENLNIEEITRILDSTELEKGNRQDVKDPLIHFYEIFLQEYAPIQKVRKGVFYTPNAVVSFIIKSVDYLIKTELKYKEGLADARISILDPAIGTGTFLKELISQIKGMFDKKNENLSSEKLQEKWNDHVSQNLLSRMAGFEILPTPFILAYLNILLSLKKTGYSVPKEQQIQLFLGNALESSHSEPVEIIIGNPPYSRASRNKGMHIENLMNTYKEAVREEKNIQPLSDDYIKFIRNAQEIIERTGYGIIGFVTNHTYLTGLIHRGMRQELSRVFNKIYILNLHGSQIIYEQIPIGEKDENVFDIRQGICIAFFVKLKEKNTKPQILYQDLFGTREKKKQMA